MLADELDQIFKSFSQKGSPLRSLKALAEAVQRVAEDHDARTIVLNSKAHRLADEVSRLSTLDVAKLETALAKVSELEAINLQLQRENSELRDIVLKFQKDQRRPSRNTLVGRKL